MPDISQGYDPSKYQELATRRHSVTSQKT